MPEANLGRHFAARVAAEHSQIKEHGVVMPYTGLRKAATCLWSRRAASPPVMPPRGRSSSPGLDLNVLANYLTFRPVQFASMAWCRAGPHWL
ncbi:hypothetical protein E2C01_022249 [Portunus trituberculatus]|uniref:Uncharacterized protein n=1 Tax=Portunus trituberculatus TaxID=210409 RepID=A0A5B7E761_PORTR|nr:hypothetical protein [Portunus trituberculatus]